MELERLNLDIHTGDVHLGGAPVSFMSELNEVESLAVSFLRQWYHSNEEREKVTRELIVLLGYYDGYKTAKSFGDLCNWFSKKGRRPLVRHHMNCECVGLDENYFAKLLATASSHQREDTMMLVIIFLPANLAPIVSDLACFIGLALKRLVLTKLGPDKENA